MRAEWRGTVLAFALLSVAVAAPLKPTRFDMMSVRADHPRIWLDRDRVSWLRKKVAGMTADDVAKRAGRSVPGLALTYVITGDERWGREAVALALGPFTPGGTKDAAQKRNSIQPLLFQLALAYDWCHPLLSAEDKARLRELMPPLMRREMASGRTWRSFHNSGHSHAFPLAAAALALHGEDAAGEEALEFLKPELEDMLKTFDLVFPDGEWGEGADYDRHSSYPALRTFLALKSATGQDFIAGSPHFRDTARYIFYGAKPDGLVNPSDDNDWPYLGGWERNALLMLSSEYRDPHAQYFLNHCPVERFRLEEQDRYADLLWYDPTLPEKPLDDLPLSRIFRGKGLVIARTGWGWDTAASRAPDTWLAFHCGDYFGDHAHYDVNSFQIHRKGNLAIDSGRYDDDWDFYDRPDKVGRSQFFNYYQRTIAHNTILVRDPGETFEMGVLNDGGQLEMLRRGGHRNVPEDYDQGAFPSDDGRGTCDWATNPGRWETGDITAYQATRDFTYVVGDGTRAYSPRKLSAFVRQLLFVGPRLVVVFDRVAATRPEFEKTWLLHSVGEPRLAADGASFEVVEGNGRLVCVPLWPQRPRLRKIGGPGQEFLVAGVRFKAGLESELHPAPLHYGEIPGAWRVEESPSAAQAEDYFLNVILLTDRGSREMPRVDLAVDGEGAFSFRVRDEDGMAAELRFAKGPRQSVSLRLARGGRLVYDGELAHEVVLEEGRPAPR
jgi:heparin/heparan-sulfate lyase